jgi:hypothetical protein
MGWAPLMGQALPKALHKQRVAGQALRLIR